ncbi:hypothetical protein RYX36_019864 [Vicia faba]
MAYAVRIQLSCLLQSSHTSGDFGLCSNLRHQTATVAQPPSPIVLTASHNSQSRNAITAWNHRPPSSRHQQPHPRTAVIPATPSIALPSVSDLAAGNLFHALI